MKFRYINLLIGVVFLALLISPLQLSAQLITNNPSSSGQCGSGEICNPIKANDLYAFISDVLTEVAKLGAVVVVFFIIYSGFLFVTAQGNEEKLKTAKKALLYTLIGAAILLGASLIATVIKNTVSELGV